MTRACSRTPSRSSSTARPTGTSPSEPASTVASAPTSPAPSCSWPSRSGTRADPRVPRRDRRAAAWPTAARSRSSRCPWSWRRVKPAPFEYHAPDHRRRGGRRCWHDLGDEAKVLAGGQSLVPMLTLRLARFEHLVDIGRIAELRGVERQNGSLLVRATTRDAVIEHDAMVADAVPLLALVTPHHRPLPDPQPGHDRRFARPRRSGRRVPGGGHRPRRHVRRALVARRALRWRPPTSSTASGRRRWQPDELLTAIRLPGVGRPMRVRRRRVRSPPR